LLDAINLSIMFHAHLYVYFKFSQKLFATWKEMQQTHKKGKNDIVLTNVKASSQMEDERN
jgi:hypothetical protein